MNKYKTTFIMASSVFAIMALGIISFSLQNTVFAAITGGDGGEGGISNGGTITNSGNGGSGATTNSDAGSASGGSGESIICFNGFFC
jgi:hypothetical protein